MVRTGRIVWFHAIPADQTAADFRVQTYHGQEGLDLVARNRAGWSVERDRLHLQPELSADRHRERRQRPSVDGHEFLITPWNTALILSYTTATADLTSIGGPADQTVINGHGAGDRHRHRKVLFQWNSEGSRPLQRQRAAVAKLPATPWDWFHINAVHLNTQRLTFSSMLATPGPPMTSTPLSGKINWELGGKQSSFTLRAAPGQVWTAQRALRLAARSRGDWQRRVHLLRQRVRRYSELAYGRAITVKLDQATHVATLVASDDQPEGLSAASQGNAQTTRSGGLFVGWGILPYVSQFSVSGKLLFNAEFQPASIPTVLTCCREPHSAASADAVDTTTATSDGGA